jgi:cyclophilin family peptidyl-prolyl cis-trans isomerase
MCYLLNLNYYWSEILKHIFKLYFIFLLSFTSLNIYAEENIKFVIDTTKGNIVIETYPKKAPITVKNFESYVNKGFYDNTIFHRVIDGFMIQGGGFTKDMAQKQTDAPIQNEASNGLKNEKYTIAMARTSIPDSATSQFFINVNNNNFLDYPGQDGAGYCVFGKVIEGQDVVDKIAKLKTRVKNGMGDVPIKTVMINSIKVK